MGIKLVDNKWLERRAKTLETILLNKYGKSLSWITILNRLNLSAEECDLDANFVFIDAKKYLTIRREIIAECEKENLQ